MALFDLAELLTVDSLVPVVHPLTWQGGVAENEQENIFKEAVVLYAAFRENP